MLSEESSTRNRSPQAIPTLLSSVSEPQLVKKLAIDSAHPIPDSNFIAALSTLVNPEDLSLVRQAYSLDDGFYEVLAKLLLRKLTFGPGTSLSWASLKDKLFNVYAPRALQVLNLSLESTARANPWASASWDDDFSFEDCMELVELASGLGVDLRGSTIAAAAVEVQHRSLTERRGEVNLDEQPGTSNAKGDEEVEDEKVEECLTKRKENPR